MYYFKLIGINPLFINIPNGHNLGFSFIKYTSEKKHKYPITAENVPCDNIIFLQVLPNWIVSIGLFSKKITDGYKVFIFSINSSLKLSDYIVVTCDSTSMISEAAMTGKPIYVAQMKAVRNNNRFKKFFESFKSLNIIKDLENSLEKWSYEKLNETDKISSYIKEQLKNYDFS